ncbi:MAG TPA: hypothetical protein VF590_27975 [Isosphaeraceae bacterium]|jgi:hypothetical protein
MAADDYYRGGTNLKPRPFEVRVDPVNGMLLPTHGISVFSRPDYLDQFGGAYRVTNVPEELTIIRRGRDPNHFEIVPARTMTLDEYEAALGKIVLVPS